MPLVLVAKVPIEGAAHQCVHQSERDHVALPWSSREDESARRRIHHVIPAAGRMVHGILFPARDDRRSSAAAWTKRDRPRRSTSTRRSVPVPSDGEEADA